MLPRNKSIERVANPILSRRRYISKVFRSPTYTMIGLLSVGTALLRELNSSIHGTDKPEACSLFYVNYLIRYRLVLIIYLVLKAVLAPTVLVFTVLAKAMLALLPVMYRMSQYN